MYPLCLWSACTRTLLCRNLWPFTMCAPQLILSERRPALVSLRSMTPSGWSTCNSIECDVVRAYGVFDYLTTRNSSIATNQGPWSERQGGGCVCRFVVCLVLWILSWVLCLVLWIVFWVFCLVSRVACLVVSFCLPKSIILQIVNCNIVLTNKYIHNTVSKRAETIIVILHR